MLNTFFFKLCIFLSFCLRWCPFYQGISAFVKLLNCIRQEGKSFEEGAAPLYHAGFSPTSH